MTIKRHPSEPELPELVALLETTTDEKKRAALKTQIRRAMERGEDL